jgi:hypothetical protein
MPPLSLDKNAPENAYFVLAFRSTPHPARNLNKQLKPGPFMRNASFSSLRASVANELRSDRGHRKQPAVACRPDASSAAHAASDQRVADLNELSAEAICQDHGPCDVI